MGLYTFKTPFLLPWLRPYCHWKGPDSGALYLSFDDGPHPEISLWVAEQLAPYRAKARFFCVGENLMRYPEVAQALAAAGHGLSNHTHRHLKGWNCSLEAYLEDVARCEAQLPQVGPRWFRPPYGRATAAQLQALRAAGYELAMWSFLSGDFDAQVPINRAFRACRAAAGGSIVVFHDSLKAERQLKMLLPDLLAAWAERGLRFELL